MYSTSDHVKIYYEDHGSGEPIILVHGLTANHRHFQKQVPVLRKKYRVITYDLRGHGDSERVPTGLTMKRLSEDLKELIDYLELSNTSMIGWSLGAHVIFEYIRHYGCSNLNKTCILDMTPRLLKSDNWNLGLRGVTHPEFGTFDHADNLLTLSALCGNWEIFSRRLVERLMNKNLMDQNQQFNYAADFKGKNDMEWLYSEALINTQSIIVCFWIALACNDYRSLLPSIETPTLITYGAESNYYAASTAEYMRDTIPNATLSAFSGCGHALHIQDPEKFNSDLSDFLAS